MSDNKKESFFSKLFSGNEEDVKTRKKLTPKLVVILLAIGILLMLSSNMLSEKKVKEAVNPVFQEQTQQQESNDVPAFASKSKSSSEIDKYEEKYERQLKEALEKVMGVKDVTVVVNLESSELKILEKDTVTRSQQTHETDREGGKRDVEDQSEEKKVVITRKGDQETPIVIQTEKPDIRGVLIVAKGADNIKVKTMIVEAVTRMLGVSSHRVSVLPKKN
ncbi:stage III sporulation protein AG [Bacillus sp. 165]|uniref:stage III sporulation protein AG n=1 Tax=Bacillus sp. 165 TaxID=1529117 RepID=UPI001ADCAB65|nr:stage III sporulation protein AG [Bacillus sp. 165]MBO9129705.1 stage III sporulation protein AG [Bacillus sp. 165]